MHNRAAIAAIAPRSRSSRRDRGAIANKFLQGIVSRSTADLTWRMWFKSTEITKNYFLPQVVPKFPLLGITLIGFMGYF